MCIRRLLDRSLADRLLMVRDRRLDHGRSRSAVTQLVGGIRLNELTSERCQEFINGLAERYKATPERVASQWAAKALHTGRGFDSESTAT